MRPRQDIKQSEARILVYLSIVHNTRKHVTAITNALENDYSYTMRILQAMTAKGWLKKHAFKRHMFYDLTEAAPLESAKKSLLSDDITTRLQKYSTPDVEVVTQITQDSREELEAEIRRDRDREYLEGREHDEGQI